MTNNKRIEQLKEDILHLEGDLNFLRKEYRLKDKIHDRDVIVSQAKIIKSKIMDIERDIRLYENIEKMKQIAKEVGQKGVNK